MWSVGIHIYLYITVNLLVSVSCYDPERVRTLCLTALAPCNCQHQIQSSDLALMTDSEAASSHLPLSYMSTLPPIL